MDEQDSLTNTMAERLTTPGVGWWVFGLAILALLAWVGLNFLGWIIFGLFTYYIGRPITRRLSGRIESRSLTAALTMAFIILPILAFLAVFLAVALGQALSFLSSEEVAAILERLPTEELPTDPVEVVVVVLQDPQLSSLLDQFGVVVAGLASTLFNLFLMLIFVFFLLVEDHRLRRWFEENVVGSESLTVDYLRGVDRGLTSIYFGYTLTIFVVIIVTAVIYTVFNAVAPQDLRIPSAVLLAAVTGVFTLVPLVGRSIVYAFIVALLSIQALDIGAELLWVPLAFLLFMIVVFDNVIRTYVRPYLSGKAYDMSLVMFGYLLGPTLFGWYGVFMGPFLMVVVVEFFQRVLPIMVDVEGGAGVTPASAADTFDEGTVESEESSESGRGGSPSG